MKGYRTPSNFLSCLFCLLSVCKDPHTADDEEGKPAKKPHMDDEEDSPEAFRYLKRIIVTPAVYPGLFDFHYFDIQSTVEIRTRGQVAEVFMG